MTDIRRSALTLFVAGLTARSRLSDEERDAVLALPGKIEIAHKDQDVVVLGDVVDRTCLVVEGLLGRFGQTRDGRRQITALYIPGDMPDLHSFVLPRSTWALMALTRTTVLRVPHVAIAKVDARYPAVAKAFWRDCSIDAAVTSQWMLNIGRRDARGRVAHLLCEMAVRYAQIGTSVGLSFPLPLNQAHLADATGMTPVHINRTLAALRTANIVDVTRRTVRIHNWTALAEAADFDPQYLQLDEAGAVLPLEPLR